MLAMRARHPTRRDRFCYARLRGSARSRAAAEVGGGGEERGGGGFGVPAARCVTRSLPR